MNKFFSHASATINSIRKRGLKKTVLFVIGEYWFDFKFGVNTRPHLLNGDSSIVGSHVSKAEPHYGTNWFVLKGVFGELIRKELLDPAATHMVDFGCGAGRALMAALYFGVAMVTGVEFSKMLCMRAEENLEKFIQRNIKNPDSHWDVVHADASLFVIPQHATLFFLYNPFGSPVIDMVAQNIREFASTAKRMVTVIYVNPVHYTVFEHLGYTKLKESNDEVAIYTCC